MSLMTLCFPEEIDDHGTFVEISDIVNEAAPHDEYIDEMFAMSLSQIEEITPLELASPFYLFEVSVLEIVEEIQVAPALEVAEDVIVVDGLFDGPVGLVEGAFDFVDPPLSFYVLSGFVSRHDYVSDFSSMDLSIFEYLPIFYRVSPTVGDTEIVDFGAANHPRELRIRSNLSTDERDSLIQLLRSYLDVFAWSYEDMPGLDPSIVQHREEGDSKVAQCRIFISGRVPGVAGQCRPCSQKGRQGHSMLSFMDGFSRYSKILMAPNDMEKTSFITEWGTYCYRVMPFGLKNAGATY
ncbi:hypothetical protein CK203_107495 [Vitis vinifera]|uniref:Uncharacterized protein n=1 Tax=Vitis vinifera TaxID=29760 RepID=A0A438CIS1_VITVI|nr:hypothetical protein CK203_107495 [Vitis vinifera]